MNSARYVELPIEQLHDPHNLPAYLSADIDLTDLEDDIKLNGIITPLIARVLPDGTYELISGFRRKNAAKNLGIKRIPVILKELNDEQAFLQLIGSNCNRKPFPICTQAQIDRHYVDTLVEIAKKGPTSTDSYIQDRGKSAKRLAETINKSRGSQICLCRLIPGLQKKVNNQKLALTTAIELSDLSNAHQNDVLMLMEKHKRNPTQEMAHRLVTTQVEGDWSIDNVEKILLNQPAEKYIQIRYDDIKDCFPVNLDKKTIARNIIDIVKEHRQELS